MRTGWSKLHGVYVYKMSVTMPSSVLLQLPVLGPPLRFKDCGQQFVVWHQGEWLSINVLMKVLHGIHE